jgi:hypothetical protein
VPIPGYYEHVKETLMFLKKTHPNLKRAWFIRHFILPPKGLLDDEEIGLHVTEPRNILTEYDKVSKHFKRELCKFTRHGFASAASGRLWTQEDQEYVRSVLPHMVDLTNSIHYTVNSIPNPQLDKALSTNFSGMDNVLFHPEHLRLNVNDLDRVLSQIEINGDAKGVPH